MKYSHYYKTLPCLTVDVYRVLHAFDVTDPCHQHAAKKIMVAGGRGAKDAKKDVEEAIDSLVRWLEMRREESGENMQGNNLSVSICDSMNLADSFLKDIRAVGSNGRVLQGLNFLATSLRLGVQSNLRMRVGDEGLRRLDCALGGLVAVHT